MKVNKMIGTSLLCALLLSLGACGSNQSAPSHKQQQPTSNQSNNIGNNSASSKGNGSQNQNSDHQQGSAKQNDESTQSENTRDNGGTGSTEHQKSNSAPISSQEVMKKVAASIETRVPLMLPTEIPMASGKFLSATTKSEAWYYNTKLYETNQPTSINSEASSQGTPIAMVEGTEYKSDSNASDQINGYIQVHPSKNKNYTINLGHKIEGVEDAGAGHAYITWNEGRWCIKIDSPNDPKYKTKKYQDSKKLARKMVSYLEDHALPAPERIGVVSVSNWNNGMKTTIHWQYHEMTYKVTSRDPFQALKTAVRMTFEK